MLASLALVVALVAPPSPAPTGSPDYGPATLAFQACAEAADAATAAGETLDSLADVATACTKSAQAFDDLQGREPNPGKQLAQRLMRAYVLMLAGSATVDSGDRKDGDAQLALAKNLAETVRDTPGVSDETRKIALSILELLARMHAIEYPAVST